MERDLIQERTKAGLAAARLAGKVGGRRPALTPTKLEAARQLLRAGRSPREVATVVGVSIATLYRHLPAVEHSDPSNLLRL